MADPRTTPWHTRLWGYVSRSATERYLAREVVRLRAALAICAGGFVVKRIDQDTIDFEGIAREFHRRMAVAKEALAQ